jgi:purine nucleosidase
MLVDCDTGIDDALALLYLVRRPEVDVVGVTTVFGNNTVETAARNTRRVLALAGRPDIPVGVGADRPLVGERESLGTEIHGADGLGDVNLPDPPDPPSDLTAAELISTMSRRYPGSLHLLATGALTNLAAALDAEPELVDRVGRVTVMGGAADAPGNRTPAAEANIGHDPEAAQRVLAAGWATDLVPLDVTMRELLTERHRAALAAAGTPVGSFASSITDFYFNAYSGRSGGERWAPCHDALAAAVAVGTVTPSLFPAIHVEVDCTDGPSRGATICDTRGRYWGFPPDPRANCRVALRTAGDFADHLVAVLLS